MTHLPALISDLALLLIVAGITTLLFKRINQPLVIGYIVAGFLIGPVVDFIPTITDTADITVWADIGVIFLMFALGLEFSIHKLMSVGSTGIITAVTEIVGMLLLGFGAGQLMGWSTMNSIFLGGMLSMSSTTIIIKAFDDLKLRGKKFTELVFGTLVIEDIAGIFMMIILSTISVSHGVSGGELAITIGKLVFYLAIWLILSIMILPSFLQKAQKLMNEETLLVVSLGICFGMVVLANGLGFSSALGAFLAGSVLAGTIHAEKVEHLVKPCKDLFGAVFFVSVGMMVDPAMLIQYVGPILLIMAITIIGKILFVGMGMLVAGQDLYTSIHSAFSLAQIGEFSFIIASLGNSLGVTSDFLYPIVVAVSVITTFTTPFCISRGDFVYRWLQKVLPEKWLNAINRNSQEKEKQGDKDRDWSCFLKQYFSTLIFYGIIVLGIIQLSTAFAWPILAEWLGARTGDFLTLVLTLICISPFIYPLLYCRNRFFSALWLRGKYNQPPLIILMVLRTIITAALVMLPFYSIYDLPIVLLAVVALLLVFVASRSDWLISHYLQIEARFLSNFNERILNEKVLGATEGGGQGAATHIWLHEQLYVIELLCPANSPAIGQNLIQLDWGNQMHINVIKIIRGRKHINVPAGKEEIHAGDHLFIMGQEKQVENFCLYCQQKALLEPVKEDLVTLKDFVASQDQYDEDKQILCYAVKVEKGSAFVGKSIKDSRIKSYLHCYLIGLERNLLPILNPNPNMMINAEDIIWVLGPQEMASKLVHSKIL